MTEKPRLDDFTKRYLVGLLVIAVLGFAWWFSGWDRRIGQLNAILEADEELSAYPYQFKVLSLEDGVAEISSPRSAEVPVIKFLRIVFPQLRDSSVTDESVMAAQDELVTVQSRAGKLVSDEEDVKSIRWSLDRQWYESQGMYLD
ncbi:Uncharacterised protein [Halioglobus japonicus]|nr:Uncharacterised protein [Halioglobus japonicus]